MAKKKINVKSHTRKTPSGKITNVREHDRIIRKNAVKLMRSASKITRDRTANPKIKKFAKESKNFAESVLREETAEMNARNNTNLTVEDVIRINKEKGRSFFSPDTMKFFDSKIETEGKLIGNRFFITSEKKSFDNPSRVYTVREFIQTGGLVRTPNVDGEYGFGAFETKKEAKEYAKELARKSK